MTDREEREEHIKRLEAALACEEKQSSGKCSKQLPITCDDNCALLYEQGNWGEWRDTLRYAINSLKIDLKYDLLYEETSEQADKQAHKPTTKNDLGVDAVLREAVNELVLSQRLDTFSDEGRKWANIKIDVILRGLKELPSTPQAPRWTPVSEGLPKESGDYLVTISFDVGAKEPVREVYKDFFCVLSQKWLNHDEDVIAWMPLPKPYEPQESEDNNGKID